MASTFGLVPWATPLFTPLMRGVGREQGVCAACLARNSALTTDRSKRGTRDTSCGTRPKIFESHNKLGICACFKCSMTFDWCALWTAAKCKVYIRLYAYICMYVWAYKHSRMVSAVLAFRVRYPTVIFNMGSYLVSAFHGKALLIAQTMSKRIGAGKCPNSGLCKSIGV